MSCCERRYVSFFRFIWRDMALPFTVETARTHLEVIEDPVLVLPESLPLLGWHRPCCHTFRCGVTSPEPERSQEIDTYGPCQPRSTTGCGNGKKRGGGGGRKRKNIENGDSAAAEGSSSKRSRTSQPAAAESSSGVREEHSGRPSSSSCRLMIQIPARSYT